MTSWGKHVYRIGTKENYDVSNPTDTLDDQKALIEPWLSAIFQSEHLGLLIGSGFTAAIAQQASVKSCGMLPNYKNFLLIEELQSYAKKIAENMGRGDANIEDQIRTVNSLIQGLRILKDERAQKIKEALDKLIGQFLKDILATEQGIKEKFENLGQNVSKDNDSVTGETADALEILISFLLSFASRTATRERLQIFTTNYDRLIEYGADLSGLHILERFVGSLEPIFRSSRLDIDMHYNPPGIRGEPRYLEGVVHLTKLHGSVDWLYKNGFVKKVALPFGAVRNHPAINDNPSDSVMIYPNSAKDRETAEYPYVELFRDYAAAICRPNSVLVTYGYGFGDEHINRAIFDMLTIPSTHLVIISHSDTGGRISGFYKQARRKNQISLLLRPHFGHMPTLVEHYLPKPGIDRITMRQVEILQRRQIYSAHIEKTTKEAS